MNQDLILGVALPLTLFCMMFSMGTTLRLSAFTLLLQRPFPVLVGLCSQLLLLPLIALAVLQVLPTSPAIYAGFLILALSPGGSTSNVFTYMAGGNVALSITLTALVSLLAPFTLPLAANWLLASDVGGDTGFSLPVLPTVISLLLITVVPVSLGMLLRRWRPRFCATRERAMTRIPFLMLLAVIAGIIVQNGPQMPGFLRVTGVPALLLASLALVLGYLFAKTLRLTSADARTVAIETAIQNGGTAMLVTGTILNNPAMTVAPVMYGILMLLPLFALLFFQRLSGR